MPFSQTHRRRLTSNLPFTGEDDAGFDFYDAKISDYNGVIRVSNSLSQAMMRDVITGVRSVTLAYVKLDDGAYPVDLSGFESTYATMKKCENYRLGIMLEN